MRLPGGLKKGVTFNACVSQDVDDEPDRSTISSDNIYRTNHKNNMMKKKEKNLGIEIRAANLSNNNINNISPNSESGARGRVKKPNIKQRDQDEDADDVDVGGHGDAFDKPLRRRARSSPNLCSAHEAESARLNTSTTVRRGRKRKQQALPSVSSTTVWGDRDGDDESSPPVNRVVPTT